MKDDWTPLQFATSVNDVEVMKWLMGHDSDVDTQTMVHKNPHYTLRI